MLNTKKEKLCKNCEKPAKQFLKGMCAGCYRKLQKEKEAIKAKKVREKRVLSQLTVPKIAVLVQKLCRLTGTEKCVTCGSTGPQFHAGHWRSRRYSSTIFYMRNMNNQCANCNIFLKGEEYLHGKYVEEKYGADMAEKILEMSRKTYRWSKPELQEIKDQVAKHIDMLNQGVDKETVRNLFIDWQESTEWFKNLTNDEN